MTEAALRGRRFEAVRPCCRATEYSPCGRRVGKLYLPPGGRYYGCRHCHRLTYRSCQESHKDDKLFRLMAGPGDDPDELRRAFNRLCKRNR